MNVFITNDDGIRAVGIRALWTALREAGHKVYVVAPMQQQSGVGHSLTFFSPLQAVEYEEADGFSGLAVDGTPTDCVKLALSSILPTRPDIVISGLNAGSNVGPDVLYSGTVAAATEACHEGLPSLAISNHDMQNGDALAKARHAVKLAEKIDWSKIPERRVINVNYPKCSLAEAKGLRVCVHTEAVWKNGYIERIDPRGQRYWWLSGEIPLETVNAGSDYDLLRKGYITVSPLRFDFNDEKVLSSLEEMKL